MAGPKSLNLQPSPLRLPAEPGSYALLLHLPEPARIAVGRLGAFDFAPGAYLYLGSAHGPGGLRGRVAHHLRQALSPHWHIDYLRAYTEVQQVWWAVGREPLECQWSQAVLLLPGASLPAPGFGSSDCQRKCLSHLVALGEGVREAEILAALHRGDVSFPTKSSKMDFTL